MTTGDECNCLSSPNMLYGPCKWCEQRAEQAKAKEAEKPTQWHPQPGERVLVEAVVTEVSEDDGDYWLDMPRDQFGRFLLTEIRPLPTTNKEIVNER